MVLTPLVFVNLGAERTNNSVMALANSAPMDSASTYSDAINQLDLDRRIYSTATLDDDFCDSRIIVVMNRQASRDLRYISTREFSEVGISSVEDVSPALQLAKNSRAESMMMNGTSSNIDPDWNVDTDNFRRILTLTLRNPGRENVLRAIRVLERRGDIVGAEPNFYEGLDTNRFEQDAFATCCDVKYMCVKYM